MIFWVCVVALLASLLTFFSGFGLGTLLLPVMSMFFPIEIAILSTAIIHFSNNIFKFGLTFKYINQKILWTFGLPAILAAFIGAYILKYISSIHSINYQLAGYDMQTSLVKIIIAILILCFIVIELHPYFQKINFNNQYLPVGGMLSGFFGGLSGHQGALRSMFLSKAQLSKETFIATGIAIACLIDISRMSMYIPQFRSQINQLPVGLLFCATVSAIVGAIIGNRLLKKVTITSIQRILSVCLIVLALALGFGLI